MESESGTNNTKISDSGYSNSCSNTASQGSDSSKSRHSGGSNSSRSSGGGAPKPNESDETPQASKRNRDREYKKKKSLSASALPTLATIPQAFTVPNEMFITTSPAVNLALGAETALSPPALEIAVPSSLDVGPENVKPLLIAVVPQVQADIEIVPIDDDPEDKIQLGALEDPIVPTEFDKPLLEADPMPSSQSEVNDGFCCVISMCDGVVLYTTPSLTSVLGFPKDMWLGHSFIDYVHPKDRETFSSQVSSVALPAVDSHGKIKDIRNYLYVCLRKYTNAKPSGSVEKSVSYQAFHLTLTIRQLADAPTTSLCNDTNGLFLLIVAVPIFSAYKVPGERKKSAKFGMRHSATCIFNHVDPDVVPNFGFLPQDMLGKSVFDFYHPEDMPFLKEVYKSVMKTCHINGSVFRSKPYRFLVQNGYFAMIETEWSSVVNPWSRRLEFVISLHQVLQGPLNPDVFDVTSDEEYKKIPDEAIKRGKLLQTEILQVLTKEMPKPAQIGKEEASERCKALANFVESFMNTSKLEIDVSQEINPSISERDSIMLGEISPHHDFCDSKSSSETPPSYNQLNYNENITRFFQSNPKTTVTSDESNSVSNVMDTDGKNSQDCTPCVPNAQKCLSPLQNSGASGCGSAGNLSSSSNPNLESGTTSGTNTSNDEYKSPLLTESILVRHNEEMAKIMIQKHKKERSHMKDRETKKSQQKLEKYANEVLKEDDTNDHNHGIKRSGSHSWEEDCHKLSKQNRQNETNAEDNGSNAKITDHITLVTSNVQNPLPSLYKDHPANDANLWSPFSVAAAPPAQNFSSNSASEIFPVYYLPTFVHPRPNVGLESGPRCQVPMQYVPAGVLCNYNPIFMPSPFLCPTVPVIPVSGYSVLSPGKSDVGNSGAGPKVNSGSSYATAPGTSAGNEMPSSDQQHFGNCAPNSSRPPCDRPSSQATSVKAEPGSRMGSIASASVVNKALSECSRKDLGLQSVCSPDTPLVSPPDGETQAEQFNTNAKLSQPIKRPTQLESKYRTNRMDEESSCYSSSYSSLLKTETASGSNDDSTFNNNTNRTDDEILTRQRQSYPMRKKDPPWVESVSVSSDLIYRYQMTVKDLEEILKKDLDTLKGTEQPMMVNDQLHQLYIEMELEGLSKALTLEEGFSSSSSSSEEHASNSNINKPKKKKRSYSSLVMIYEGDAPLPAPDENS